MDLVISLGDTGVVVGDLGLRLYAGDVALSTAVLTLTPIGPDNTDYVLGSLPSTAPEYTLTAEYPAGVYHAYRWGSRSNFPALVVIPIREAGHTIGSLSAAVFRNGVADASALTLVELGSPGDYALSGWSAPSPSERMVARWSLNGITFAHVWGASTPVAATFTRYLEILSNQPPFEAGSDDAGRVLFSVNFSATAVAPSDKVADEFGKILVDAGVGVMEPEASRTIFVGGAYSVPAGDGPFVSILTTGGPPPLETHNGSKYERLTIQILTRAASLDAARTKALAVWRALDGKRNITVAA